MKLQQKIEIDLLEFFKTGKFDYLEIGKSKEWILNNFPDPDDYMGDDLFSASGWRYGNLELYFNKENNLTQIFSDYINNLEGGNSLNLNLWLFSNPKNLTLENFLKNLNKENINYIVKHIQTQFNYQTSVGLLNSNIHLNFQPNDEEVDYENLSKVNRNNYILCSFSKISAQELKTAYNT